MRNVKLLLIEDDSFLGYALKEYLVLQNFEVFWEKDGEAGVSRFIETKVDLCIIDVMMPKKDGFDTAGEIRGHNPNIPLVFLTARAMKVDKLKGFRLGADDYITKPVDEEELVARIRAVLRRSVPGAADKVSQFQIGNFFFDSTSQRLTMGSLKQHLTEKENRLLALLCQRPNQLVTREEALKKIWGQNDYFNRKSMDVHLTRLRNYFKPDPTVQIVNVHGKGFILES